MISFTLNGQPVETDADPNTLLLMYLREELGLTGTKYGCGAAQCGACMVHFEGSSMFSCQITLASVAGRNIKTIEGLSENGDHPLQKAWVEEQVPQCGYCQSGQIMRAAALLDTNPSPSEDQIRSWMSTNLCRCSTYNRIVKAVQRAADEMPK
ncbi:MAG: (2Fe-2S)-binding protein [Xanthomonadales bacterium]|nr:(2Fe-2S)-binding protein [Xanthomonadales bacterium]